MNKKIKIIIVILGCSVLLLGGYIIYDKYNFPVKYKVCNTMYSDCFTVAKFDDMKSCETSKEKASWYCDTVTDPLKPDCRIEESYISASLCTE